MYSVGHHVYAQSAGSDSVVADVVGVADADLGRVRWVGYPFVAWRSMSSATSSGRSSGR